METEPNRDSLSLSAVRRIDAACLRFEDALKAGRPVKIEDFHTESGDPERAILLHELKRLEAAYRPPLPGDYENLGKLGDGAQGIVYKAKELETGRLVAFKVMKQSDPAAHDRMKKEARTLHRLCHPNLVTLFNVYSHGNQWYFAMELVDGLPFPGRLAWSDPDGSDSITTEPPSSERDDPGLPPPIVCPPPSRAPIGDLARLRDAFRQLADAIHALHTHNVLHRDIKPNNVLITPHGKVVVLDFGLAIEALPKDGTVTQPGMAGTIAYMCPAQAHGHAEKASDWYSFGVMLYETLTGQPPFRGTPYEWPSTRQGYVPPSPRSLFPDLPDDLSQLCNELLRFKPAERPMGEEVLLRLGYQRPEPPDPLPLFVGRQRHLSELANAFADSQQGRTVVVLLHGESGMGKSALAQHFLHEREVNGCLVLRGRCYEREEVPYKAIDGLIDSLRRFWRRLPREQQAELLPQEVGPLVRVFPALLRVEVVAGAPRRGNESPDPHEQRRRAFAALREVLCRIGDRWPLIVQLDDLQWGDVDSAKMLTELLMPPDPPRLLLLACFRSEDLLTSQFLRHFLPSNTQTAIDRRELPVGSLSFIEACDLAGQLLKEAGALNTEAAEAIARESGGSPFFVYPLVRASQAGEPIVLKQVILYWIVSLEEDQRRLLEIVAVAGRPLRSNTAIRAAEPGGLEKKC